MVFTSPRVSSLCILINPMYLAHFYTYVQGGGVRGGCRAHGTIVMAIKIVIENVMEVAQIRAKSQNEFRAEMVHLCLKKRPKT